MCASAKSYKRYIFSHGYILLIYFGQGHSKNKKDYDLFGVFFFHLFASDNTNRSANELDWPLVTRKPTAANTANYTSQRHTTGPVLLITSHTHILMSLSLWGRPFIFRSFVQPNPTPYPNLNHNMTNPKPEPNINSYLKPSPSNLMIKMIRFVCTSQQLVTRVGPHKNRSTIENTHNCFKTPFWVSTWRHHHVNKWL